MVIQVLSARKPRERSGPRSQGHVSPAAAPRSALCKYAAEFEKALRCAAWSRTKREAGVVRNLPPLVKVERDQIRLLNSGNQRTQRGRKCRERTYGAVDMKPETLFPGHFGYALKRIDCACVHRAGGGHDQEGRKAAERSASIAVSSFATSMRPALSIPILRRLADPSPESSIA